MTLLNLKYSTGKTTFENMGKMIVQSLFVILLIVSYIEANPLSQKDAEPDDEILIYSDERLPDGDFLFSSSDESEAEEALDEPLNTMNIQPFIANGTSSSADEVERSKMRICMELYMIMQLYNKRYGMLNEYDIELVKHVNAIMCNSEYN